MTVFDTQVANNGYVEELKDKLDFVDCSTIPKRECVDVGKG